MLKTVQIDNYQSHKSSEFEFVPGVNVIIGASDAGKSAIFNAINWVVTNRPLGESFRSEWGGGTRVIIDTDNGDTVIRQRTHSSNEYLLNGQVLAAFGAEVPDDIADALQIDAQNIQAQMDPPFLLSLTPGEAAKALNKAAAMEEIDSGISALRKTLYQLNSEMQHDQNELDRYNKEMETYDNLPALENAISNAEELDKKRQDLTHAYGVLNALHHKGRASKTRLIELNYLSKQLDPIFEAVEQDFQRYEAKRKQALWLSRFIRQIQKLQNKLFRLRNTEKAQQLLEEVEQSSVKLKNRRIKQKELSQLVKTIEQLKENISILSQKVRITEKEYNRKMPETCPLCGGLVKGG